MSVAIDETADKQIRMSGQRNSIRVRRLVETRRFRIPRIGKHQHRDRQISGGLVIVGQILQRAWISGEALGADRRKLVPEFSDDAAPLRKADVACLALASLAGEVS